jgi:hypothetical protein
MKFLKFTVTILVLSGLCLVSNSCKNESKGTEVKTEQSKQGKEYTSAYICPMHCTGSGSDKAGECPVCGMDYEKNEKYDKESHTGHNH